MLRTVKDLNGYAIEGRDGGLGKVADVYFDDAAWSVQYLVADTGTWLSGRKVLIPRLLLGRPDWNAHRFPVGLKKEQLEKAPPISADEPVSVQRHREMYSYYGIQDHWAMSGAGPVPPTAVDPDAKGAGNPHLRSSNEVMGYAISAADGEIGHAEDFIVDDSTWLIRGLVIDTRNWLPGGKKVIVPIPWLHGVSWSDASVSADLTRAQIEQGPEYDPERVYTRDFERGLHEHFERLPDER
jgi:hypothetical protein